MRSATHRSPPPLSPTPTQSPHIVPLCYTAHILGSFYFQPNILRRPLDQGGMVQLRVPKMSIESHEMIEKWEIVG